MDISWPDIAFEKYKCASKVKFGLKISDFAKVIKRTNPNDLLQVVLIGWWLIIAMNNNYGSLSIKTSGGYYIRNYKMSFLQ